MVLYHGSTNIINPPVFVEGKRQMTMDGVFIARKARNWPGSGLVPEAQTVLQIFIGLISPGCGSLI